LQVSLIKLERWVQKCLGPENREEADSKSYKKTVNTLWRSK
jgi:hypothetical protein